MQIELIFLFKDLIIIGVTGSYGKTSTKNYLYRILSEKYNTLITPGNFNTLLGVVRTIREQLQPMHQVFIVEMGAKQPGDIKEICDLVHPTIGIVTSVGEMHLETFKTKENIQKTKFELIRSLPSDGLGVINADSQGIATYKDIPTNCPIVRYGIKAPEVDYRAADIRYTASGSEFAVVHGGERTEMHTSLMGECNVLNIPFFGRGECIRHHRIGAQRPECQRRHKFRGVFCHDHMDVCAQMTQTGDNLGALVRRDASRNAQHDIPAGKIHFIPAPPVPQACRRSAARG